MVFYEKLSTEFLGYQIPQVLLLHANNLNADYLDDLVQRVKERGYIFIPLKEALKDKAYGLPEGTHSRGLSWLLRWMITSGRDPKPQPEISGFIEELFESYRR